jgi:hypothetical protein
LAVGHDDAGLGSALNGVYNVGRAKRNVKIRNIVLMQKRRVVGGDAYAEYADVLIFQDQMMMRLLREGNGYGSLGGECGSEQKR